ncbi:MAG: site-2 protease family protein [Opitutaceae bacterium]
MLDWSIKLFRVWGIRLEVHFTFLILLAYFGRQGWEYAGRTGLLWGCLLLLSIFTCVILHELGHSLTAMRYGVRVHRILLLPIGGMAQFDRIPREPARELAITVAGPAVNFILFGLLALILGGFSIEQVSAFPLSLRQLAYSLAAINLIMGVFNLIPVFPMDGGRIFRALLAMKTDYLSATRWAGAVGKILATAGAAVALLAFGNFLTAALFAFIYLGGDLEYRHVRREEFLKNVRIGDLVEHPALVFPASSPYSEVLQLAVSAPDADLVAVSGNEIVAAIRSSDRPKNPQSWTQQRTFGRCAHRVALPLQADWPLVLMVHQIQNGCDRLFPVYRRERFLGLLDADTVDRQLAARYFARRDSADRDPKTV